ncbi:MAG TPA: hypothetical protein DGG95_02185, partial [Cytophagales bacterium]|nr:hypothetical protein [Cytophagales bacterium]
MKEPIENRIPSNQQDAIDTDKLRAVVKRNTWWIVVIFLFCNGSAYLATRWTKDVFESESQLKLDVKRDATELGIKEVVQDQNNDMVLGEIEQIKSKVFLNKIIDSLNLIVSYYSEGNVLNNELYKSSPFKVEIIKVTPDLNDIPIHFIPTGSKTFKLKIAKNGQEFVGNYEIPLRIGTSILVLMNCGHLSENESNDYHFIINSRDNLSSLLSKNAIVEPLNVNANTIRISFKDYNKQKAIDIVNKIDSVYISYSNQQKNLANRQKIDWLNRELGQLEKRMQDYESYFEEFTLQNKSSDAAQDIKRTIYLINKYDSQRYSLNKKLIELSGLMESLVNEKSKSFTSQYSFLPEFFNKRLETLSLLMQERDRLSLAYNENTLAFRQKQKEVTALKDQLYEQLSALKTDWLNTLNDLVKEKQKLEKDFLSMPDKNTKFAKNQRFYNLYTEFYLSMIQSKAQFEIAQAGSTP